MTSNAKNDRHTKNREPARSKDRPSPVERLAFVRLGLEDGKSRRQMARELGCDDKTIRRDIEKLSLPEDQQAAIRAGDSAEKYLSQARYEKTGIDEIAAKKRRKRLTNETKTGKISDDLAELVMEWLARKGLETSKEETLLLESAKKANKKFPDRDDAPTFDPETEFALSERGRVPAYRPERINLYVSVLVSAIVRIEPLQAIRDAALEKALRVVQSQDPRPGNPPKWNEELARIRSRRG